MKYFTIDKGANMTANQQFVLIFLVFNNFAGFRAENNLIGLEFVD